jgi:hypothetical protein
MQQELEVFVSVCEILMQYSFFVARFLQTLLLPPEEHL